MLDEHEFYVLCFEQWLNGSVRFEPKPGPSLRDAMIDRPDIKVCVCGKTICFLSGQVWTHHPDAFGGGFKKKVLETMRRFLRFAFSLETLPVAMAPQGLQNNGVVFTPALLVLVPLRCLPSGVYLQLNSRRIPNWTRVELAGKVLFSAIRPQALDLASRFGFHEPLEVPKTVEDFANPICVLMQIYNPNTKTDNQKWVLNQTKEDGFQP